jgi:hypothetical protein
MKMVDLFASARRAKQIQKTRRQIQTEKRLSMQLTNKRNTAYQEWTLIKIPITPATPNYSQPNVCIACAQHPTSTR